MKEVTLRLSGRIQDPKTGRSVPLQQVELTGTPLQVGMIFESLKDLPGGPDIIAIGQNVDILKECETTLEQVRIENKNPSWGDYVDPHKTDEEAMEKAKAYNNSLEASAGKNMKRDMVVTSREEGCKNMFDGDQLYQQRARTVLPILVQRAKERKTITYKELGEAVGLRNFFIPLGKVCGSVATTLADLQEQWQGGDIPRITNLVIRENGQPGTYVCEQLTGDRRKVPPQREYDALLAIIYDYQKWDAVLKALGLSDNS